MTSQTTLPAESAKPGSSSENLRERLLPDMEFEEEMAAALGVSRRTVQRLGLPFERVGKRRAYRVSELRVVLRRRIARERKHNPPPASDAERHGDDLTKVPVLPTTANAEADNPSTCQPSSGTTPEPVRRVEGDAMP